MNRRAVDRSKCSTRPHIEIDRVPEGFSGKKRVGVLHVLLGCRFWFVVWCVVILAAHFLVGWIASSFLAGFFLVLFLVFSMAGKLAGHTLRCSALGALAGGIRVMGDML